MYLSMDLIMLWLFDVLCGSQPVNAVVCRWNAVWIVFFILGVGSLLPWNFFMNAKLVCRYCLSWISIVLCLL